MPVPSRFFELSFLLGIQRVPGTVVPPEKVCYLGGIVCQVFEILFSVKKICLIFIVAVICFGCNRNSGSVPKNDTENNSIASIPNSTNINNSSPRNDTNDSIASTPESLPVIETFPMAVIEVDTSSYYFENQEYYFKAYYDDLFGPPFRFSFYDGLFYMDIPELDLGKIESGELIKGSIQGRYTIIEENGFVYILAAEKKYLVLYNESVVCVLIDCQNNDAFFGLNKNSVYVTIREERYPYIGVTGQLPTYRRVSSFMTETVRGSIINYDGSNEKYFMELKKPWVEGVEGHGIGEWIEVKYAGNKDGISGILFFNGYIDPNRPDLFYANSRIKEVLVTSKQYSWTYQIQDTPNPQILPLPKNFDDIIRFTIMDVYEGSRYSDTSVAGIYFLHILGRR